MFLAQSSWLERLFAPLERALASLEQAIAPSPALSTFLDKIDGWVWGNFLAFILVGTGIFIAWRTRFIQLRQLKHAIALVRGKYDDPADEGDINHFQALATALSATIGTGNIAGVATAIAAGGPGAVFWMWVTGLLGAGLKFTSCTLGMQYRVFDDEGNAAGGPMYYLERGLGRRWLGSLIKLAVVVASFFAGSAVAGRLGAEGVALQGFVILLVMAAINLAFWQFARLWTRAMAPAAQALDPLLTRVRFEKWLAWVFALFAAIASFGIGNMIQANSMALPLHDDLHIPRSLSGILLAVLAGLVIIGGIKRIGRFTGKLTPVMTVIYVVGALVILVKNAGKLPMAFDLIFSHAFSPAAATGGFLGSTVSLAIQKGVARGVFSNESGLGSAPIAHAAAKTKEPVREGLVAMIGPFVDTLLICSMTALVILSTGAWTLIDPATGAGYDSTLLSKQAFQMGLPGFGNWIVTLGIILFTFSTIIGWSYYGDRSVGYLFGTRGVHVYRWIYILLIPIGAAMKVSLMWTIADITNGLMAFPNLVGLIFLSPVMVTLMKDYFSREQRPLR
ncbi:sodium:alanine symporter family protein [bacterium]|nr:sodium:alanine symporter family protein [bacterium]